MKLPVKRLDGSSTGEEVELDPRLFGLERNDHVLYMAVKAELANRRQGTHSTKGRSEVRGGGRKPWRQKGRGAARAGTIRSPLWVGGGITFGPKSHGHEMKLPKKVKQLARKIALSDKAQNHAIELVEDYDFDRPKTKRAAEILKNFDLADCSVLLLVNGYKPNVVKSCNNIPRVAVRESGSASTYDIVRANRLLITRSALDNLVGGFAREK